VQVRPISVGFSAITTGTPTETRRVGYARCSTDEQDVQIQTEQLPEPARRSIRRRYAEGEVSLADLATEYSVGRSTIHRIIHGQEVPR
jgi:DNA invertase Pin-like site-specific DNA recombinase